MNYSPYSGRNIGFGIACREAYCSDKSNYCSEVFLSSKESNTMQRYIVRYTNIYGQAESQFVTTTTEENAKLIAKKDEEVSFIHEVVLSGRQ